MFCGQLQQITITRNYGDIHSRFLPHTRKRSQNIVRLISLFFHNSNSHRSKHFLHQWHLLTKLFCHRLTCSLIALIHLMTKSRCMNVKSNRDISRLFLFQYFKHDIQKSIHRIGVNSFRIRQIRKSKKCSI